MKKSALILALIVLLMSLGCGTQGGSAVQEPTIAPAAETTAPERVEIVVEKVTPSPEPTAEPTPSPSEIPYVTLEGQTLRCDAVSLTLTDKASLSELDKFPLLESVNLMSLHLELSEMRQLCADYPKLAFAFSFTAFGIELNAETTYIDIHGTALTSPDSVMEILPYLPALEKMDMRRCGLANEQMETLCTAYPAVKFVWEVKMGDHVLRTDLVGFSTKNPSKYYNDSSSEEYIERVKNTRRLYDEDIQVLKYCTDLVALDLGHNYISDLSVLENLPKLQILILADNKLVDISVLSKLKELVYVEIFMNLIVDLSPLEGHEHMLDLNFCHNKVVDLTPLYGLGTLERVWCADNEFKKADGDALQGALPECDVNYTTPDDTADGWREHERYTWMREYFADNSPYNPS